MAYGQNPLLHPSQVNALLAGWYDIVGPQVGNWGGGGYPGSARGYGVHRAPGGPMLYLGADPQTGAPILAPAGPPAPMGPPPAPMGPPPGPPMGPPMGHPMAHHMGMPFAPRAALVDAPAPTQANRDILPMSTGVPILPTQSAQITGRPQVMAFKANTYKISDAGTAGGAADWIVNDIKIGNRSQFVQSGDVPGDVFGTRAIDTFVRFETAQTAMDIVVVVTYIGLNESGCPFFSAMIGTAAV